MDGGGARWLMVCKLYP